VENMHCAGCMRRIENGLLQVPGVVGARANLSTRRVTVDWRRGEAKAEDMAAALDRLGYRVAPVDPDEARRRENSEDRRLLIAMAVAGFAAANIMLLSVSVWSGGAEMGDATRTLLHWISALIALPTVAYAGQPFFHSAINALRHRSMNMDVPISLAILLAVCMSVVETWRHGPHAYFDAAVGLLFFLLIGRYLDRRMRAQARSVAENLLAFRGTAATVVEADGSTRTVPADVLKAGMEVLVAPGERVPADGEVTSGSSDVDTSLITGESVARAVAPGSEVHAGTLNLTGVLRMKVTAVMEDTLLAEVVRLMEAAEQNRARYVRLADRMARIYSPAVHILAALTVAGWLIAGAGVGKAVTIAIAVLIITCPCALGLAVPAVQVVASGRLFKAGILLKAGDALERLAKVDHIVFDKTGTLTLGRPELLNAVDIPTAIMARAAALAAASKHPLARALAAASPASAAADVTEVPGHGLERRADGGLERLGKKSWVAPDLSEGAADTSELWYAAPGVAPVCFRFADALRDDAVAVIAKLKQMGIGVTLLSGDRQGPVRAAAVALGIDDYAAEQTPQDKIKRIEALKAQGKTVAMVGDGLNDAPSLAAAFVSLSPSSAADISQTAADFVFQGDRLTPVVTAVRVSRAARRLVMENFALSVGYNILAVPIAIAGFVTPLIAAVAMSSSSLIVTGNALRLRLMKGL
jgi:Cu2+-exporting ATPase